MCKKSISFFKQYLFYINKGVINAIVVQKEVISLTVVL
jgi:hypothetical protein